MGESVNATTVACLSPTSKVLPPLKHWRRCLSKNTSRFQLKHWDTTLGKSVCDSQHNSVSGLPLRHPLVEGRRPWSHNLKRCCTRSCETHLTTLMTSFKFSGTGKSTNRSTVCCCTRANVSIISSNIWGTGTCSTVSFKGVDCFFQRTEALEPARQSHSKGWLFLSKNRGTGTCSTVRCCTRPKGVDCFFQDLKEPAHPPYATHSEFTNCPRTTAVLGELATLSSNDGSLKRVEQKTVSSQILIYANENMNRTHIDTTGNRLRLMDGERLSEGLIWMAQHSSGSRMRSRHDRNMLVHRTTLTKLMR